MPLEIAARCGHEPTSGIYYEMIGGGGSTRHPWLFIHGGAGTGAVFRRTPDGRSGWAELLAADGHQCWLADWPGMGRSGGTHILDVDLDTVVDGFCSLLRDVIGVPCIVVCHSMGGPIAWRLAELVGDFVAGIVALSPSNPGNLDAAAEVISRNGKEVTLRHPESGVDFTLRTDRQFIVTDENVVGQWIASSTRFPLAHLEAFRHTLVPTPPKVVLQRLGAEGGIPRIARTEAFDGLWLRIVVPTDDPARTRENTQPLLDLFRSWDADAEAIHLADRGIHGNGHFMFCELNSDEVLSLVRREIDTAFLNPGVEPT